MFQLIPSKTGVTFIMMLFLSGCGGSGGNSGSDEIATPPPKDDDTPTVFTVYEGRSVTLTVDLENDPLLWEQISGPPVTFFQTTPEEITVTAPWIIDGPQLAEFEVSATIDGETVSQFVSLNIIDRRYLVLSVSNSDVSTSNLYIDYISANDDDGVPEAGIQQLTFVEPSTRVCGAGISPNGQYIAYSVKPVSDFINEPCRGLFIVDIETQETQKVSKLTQDSQDIEVNDFSWSPDGLKIVYRGDHGENIEQIYVIDINAETTSYINYGNNAVASNLWPEDNLFPIEDGDINIDGLSLIEDLNIGLRVQWLANSNGLSFAVADFESGDYHPYQASVHGDAQKIERSTLVAADIFDIDTPDFEEALDNCTPDNPCAAPPPSLDLSPIRREFINPTQMETSVDGHLSFISTMITNNETFVKVLSVQKPVIDNTSILESAPIEAVSVLDVEWSPVAPHLAFAAEDNTRHRHADTLQEVFGYEIPGQLYFLQDYQPAHSQAHERLAYPRPDIDDNVVRELQWSTDGAYIAYARGEPQIEDTWLTSLWVTFIDETRDESQATIDDNTQLLLNLRNTDEFIRDFMWSPDGLVLIALVESNSEASLYFLPRDGSQSFSHPLVRSPNVYDNLASIGASFSEDGRYLAYVDRTSAGDTSALYVQPSNGDARITLNTPIQTGGRINNDIQWSPHGDAVIYSINIDGASLYEKYISNINGENENLNLFLSSADTIGTIRVK